MHLSELKVERPAEPFCKSFDQNQPVKVLVGHSYGGAIITEAGNNPKVMGMVYVAAFAPEEGETLGGMAAQYPTPPAYSEFRQVEDGYLVLTEKGVRESFAQDLTRAEQSLLFAVQGANQSAILGTPIKKAAWHSKPSWFVIAANDHTIAPEQEISTTKRMGAKILTVPRRSGKFNSIGVSRRGRPVRTHGEFVFAWRASSCSAK